MRTELVNDVGKKNAINLVVSPFTLSRSLKSHNNLIGSWCLGDNEKDFLKKNNIDYKVIPSRNLSQAEYSIEAETCFNYYLKYTKLLSEELNKYHKLNFSERYWETLLNVFLYPLISSVIDHYLNIEKISKENHELSANVIDSDEIWYDPHYYPGGSSRLFHSIIYSIIVTESNLMPYEIIDRTLVKENINRFGDGKKSNASSKNKLSIKKYYQLVKSFLYPIKRYINGELPLAWIKYTQLNIIALGNQYLSKSDFQQLLSKAGCSPKNFYAKNIKSNKFSNYKNSIRKDLLGTTEKSPLDKIIVECIRRLIPTIYLENYKHFDKKVNSILPEKKLVFLNSQHCDGGLLIDFTIAKSVELYQSHHLMICHGGCYGVMEISIQEEIWARISDSYAMWSNVKQYSDTCVSYKMPSLRFYKWHSKKSKSSGNDILFFITGKYPNRYMYNSIYPYTIDDNYDDWQVRFLSNLDDVHLQNVVIRDFHRSNRLSNENIHIKHKKYKFKNSPRSPFESALTKAKISIQTVPQTTYLEAIIYDHPTICFWNPDVNFIRDDLTKYFDNLVEVGVLHFSPESAAKQLNKVAHNPEQWWNSAEVRSALQEFRKNICYSSDNTLEEWANFIREKSESDLSIPQT